MKLKIIKMKQVQSTNNMALKIIKKGKFKPTLITSLIQTKGRGTMGKKWISQKGNIFISIFFEINQHRINFREYALLNAYLIKGVVSNLTKKKIDIKIPNDLLIKKKKICGILQEIISLDSRTFLIVGLGINTNKSPIIKNYKTTSLSSILRRKVDNNDILKKIQKAYEKFIPQTAKYNFIKLKRKILKIK